MPTGRLSRPNPYAEALAKLGRPESKGALRGYAEIAEQVVADIIVSGADARNRRVIADQLTEAGAGVDVTEASQDVLAVRGLVQSMARRLSI